MKQYMNLSPQTACMFISVDDDAAKILAMSRVPKVLAMNENHAWDRVFLEVP